MNFIQKLFKNEVKKKSLGVPSIVTIGESINNPFYFDGVAKDDKLINEGYVSNADVYSIIKKICEVSSDVPFVVEQNTNDGWEIDEESSLNTLINNPNELVTAKEFRFETMLYLLNTGDIFWKKLTASFGLVTELELLESNLVQLLYNSDQTVQRYQYSKLDTTLIDYLPEEVIHNIYLNPSKFGVKSQRGLSPLQAGYATLKSSNNRSVAEASMLSNRGATGILSSGSDLVMTPQDREDLQKATDKLVGGAENFNKAITTTANVTWTSMGMDANQLKMLEGGVMSLRTLCNIFGVNSAMFNDQEASTLDNMKIADKKIYTDAVIPNNNKIISGYDSIIPAYNSFENKELRIVQNLSEIDALQEDQKTKAEKDKINIEAITSVLTSPISNESKIATLVEVMGYEEDKAQLIVGKEIVDNETV